jgi:hypothetical protein
MAKVIITIEDVEGNEGAISVDFGFTPALPDKAEEDETIPLTPAQTMAMHINHMLHSASTPGDTNEEETSSEAEGSAEEGCAQTGEETCCGGNCHADSAEA